MRRFAAVLTALLLALGLTACGDDDTASTAAGTTPAADLGLATPGTLRVASDIPYAPFEFTEPGSDVPVGFDVDLVDAIAERLGIAKVEFVDQSFDGILASIAAGRFDMSASSWTITPERAEQVNFSEPYFSANQAILVSASSDIASPEDLTGTTIAVQRGTIGADEAAKIEDAKVLRFENTDDAFNAVGAGRADAAITDYPVVAYAAAAKPTLKVAAQFPGTDGLGLMFPKGNTALLEAVNGALAELKADGTVDTIYEKWFPGVEPS